DRSGEGRAERLLRGDALGRAVRRMVEIVGNLERELASRSERSRKSREKARVIGDPVERGVREDEVELRSRCERRYVAAFEPESAAGSRDGLREHGCRGIETERLRGAGPTVELAGELSRSAAEVHRPAAGDRGDEIREIEERLAALGGEARVHLGL